MTRQEQANKLIELLNNHYYKFIKQIENIEEEEFDIDGIINIFINCFDEEIAQPLEDIFEENNIKYDYDVQKYIDLNED